MSVSILSDPSVFFDSLGGGHDAGVNEIWWSYSEGRFELHLDDLNSNFLGGAEYEGVRPVQISFLSAVILDLNIDFINHRPSIYEIEVAEKEGEYAVHVRLSPGGDLKLRCKSIKVVDKN